MVFQMSSKEENFTRKVLMNKFVEIFFLEKQELVVFHRGSKRKFFLKKYIKI